MVLGQLALSSISIIGFVFAVWELLESHFFRDIDYLTLHYLYVSRGVVSSLLLAFWAAWFVLRARRALTTPESVHAGSSSGSVPPAALRPKIQPYT